MKAQLKWIEGMKFEGAAEGNSLMMDAKAPFGTNTGMTPKELVAVGLGGCSAMDVIALLKKHKQQCESLDVDVEIETSMEGQPVVFTKAMLTFNVMGKVERDILLDAVVLSQTKYCGVSAMLVKALPISYVVKLNGEAIGNGSADFSALND